MCDELRKTAVSAPGDRLETQAEAQPWSLTAEGQGRGRGATDDSTRRPCPGFLEGHPDLPAHLPRGASGHPNTLSCRPNLFRAMALARCLGAGTGPAFFFLPRNVPRVTFGVESSCPQPQPSVEVISFSHCSMRKLPRLVDRLTLLRMSLQGEDLSKFKCRMRSPGGS